MTRKRTFGADFSLLNAGSSKLHLVRTSWRYFAHRVLIWTSCNKHLYMVTRNILLPTQENTHSFITIHYVSKTWLIIISSKRTDADRTFYVHTVITFYH